MDYPEVPPGVRMFNPRRIRRYRKAMGLAAEKSRLTQEARISEAEKRAVLRDLARERRRTSELEKELAKAQRPGLLKRVVGWAFRRS